MKNIEISINPLAEFLEATESRKKIIITEQLNPDKVRIFYYQQARHSIRKSLFHNGDHTFTDRGISKVKERIIKKDWHKWDKTNSIDALERWKEMILPEIMKDYPLEPVHSKAKYFTLYGVKIKVSPNGIFRVVIDGQKYIGAFKIHLSKGKAFNVKQSALVAQMLNLFLSNFVAEEDDKVDPQLCVCIDPFSGTVVTASNKMKYNIGQVKKACGEIREIWDDINRTIDVEVA